jgi:hypothetical protein
MLWQKLVLRNNLESVVVLFGRWMPPECGAKLSQIQGLTTAFALLRDRVINRPPTRPNPPKEGDGKQRIRPAMLGGDGRMAELPKVRTWQVGLCFLFRYLAQFPPTGCNSM